MAETSVFQKKKNATRLNPCFKVVDDSLASQTHKTPHLPGQILDVGALRQLLIALGAVLDVLGAVRIVDRAQRLLVRRRMRRHGGDDDRLGAAAERLLQ